MTVLVIGAGPAGLATSAMLVTRGVDVRLVDRDGRIGGAYARIDPTMLMTSPASTTALPGNPLSHPPAYFTCGEYLAYLTAYAAAFELAPERATVSAIRAVGPAYDVDGESYETIVVASGVADFPVRPTFAGTPAVPVIHSVDWNTDRHARGRVLVVGGATSAVEIAELCARRGCVTTVAARKLSLGPQTILGIDPAIFVLPAFSYLRPRAFCAGETVPAGDRGFAELRKRGQIAVHREPVSIDGNVATLADGHRCEVDLVVLATGYHHATPFLPAYLARTSRGLVRCRNNESVSARGIFVVGAPCSRSAASQYLYGISRDAERVARVIAER